VSDPIDTAAIRAGLEPHAYEVGWLEENVIALCEALDTARAEGEAHLSRAWDEGYAAAGTWNHSWPCPNPYRTET
jgi:hypothetical protein